MHQELIIEPNIDVIKKRKVFLVDFDKQVGREEKKHVDDEEVYVKNFDFEDIRPKDPSEPKVKGFEFGKAEERFKIDLKRELDIEEDMLVIEPNLPERVVKNVVRMDKGGERFKEKIDKNPFADEIPNTEMNIDVDKALKATKPDVPVVDFNRYEKVKEN